MRIPCVCPLGHHIVTAADGEIVLRAYKDGDMQLMTARGVTQLCVKDALPGLTTDARKASPMETFRAQMFEGA